MKTVPLNQIFHVTYGNKFDLNKMELVEKGSESVNFVGRSSQNHGVSGYVKRKASVPAYPAGCITVSLGGSKLLSSFVQIEPFYTAQNVAVLRPKEDLSFTQKLYICLAIRHNRFRYSAFGREANRSLRTLGVPDTAHFPAWLTEVDVSHAVAEFTDPVLPSNDCFSPTTWHPFLISDLFDIKKGKRMTKIDLQPGPTPFVGAIDKNNGVRQRIGAAALHSGNVITVNYNGSVAESFYQPQPFCASDDVNILYPKFEGFDPLVGLFFCTLFRKEKYRFSYGRKWNLERMRCSVIRAPVTADGRPAIDVIRRMMKGLSFSAAALSQG